MPTSQNGWETVDGYSSSALVPSPWLTGKIRSGVVATVLNYVAEQFNARVEKIEKSQSWGYAPRPIRGSTSISNHASGTAQDFNAERHGLGRKNTFKPEQVSEIHKILAEVDHVVRWGGDYSGRKDEMHFEIVGSFDDVKRVAMLITRPTAAKVAVQNRKDNPMIYRAGGALAAETKFGIYAHNGGWVRLQSQEEVDNLTKAGVPIAWILPQTLKALQDDSRRR